MQERRTLCQQNEGSLNFDDIILVDIGNFSLPQNSYYYVTVNSVFPNGIENTPNYQQILSRYYAIGIINNGNPVAIWIRNDNFPYVKMFDWDVLDNYFSPYEWDSYLKQYSWFFGPDRYGYYRYNVGKYYRDLIVNEGHLSSNEINSNERFYATLAYLCKNDIYNANEQSPYHNLDNFNQQDSASALMNFSFNHGYEGQPAFDKLGDNISSDYSLPPYPQLPTINEVSALLEKKEELNYIYGLIHPGKSLPDSYCWTCDYNSGGSYDGSNVSRSFYANRSQVLWNDSTVSQYAMFVIHPKPNNNFNNTDKDSQYYGLCQNIENYMFSF